MRDFDAVFVGGGVIGLACAWRAAQGGARVAVLERAEPPAGATNVAAGMLAPVGELSYGERELLEMMLAERRPLAGVRRRARGGSGVETGYRATAAPCTWPWTATRRRSCAAVTSCSGSWDSRPSG